MALIVLQCIGRLEFVLYQLLLQTTFGLMPKFLVPTVRSTGSLPQLACSLRMSSSSNGATAVSVQMSWLRTVFSERAAVGPVPTATGPRSDTLPLCRRTTLVAGQSFDVRAILLLDGKVLGC